MAEIVGEELAHAAYRGRRGDGRDEIYAGLERWVVVEVQKVVAIALPLGCMARVTLLRE